MMNEAHCKCAAWSLHFTFYILYLIHWISFNIMTHSSILRRKRCQHKEKCYVKWRAYCCCLCQFLSSSSSSFRRHQHCWGAHYTWYIQFRTHTGERTPFHLINENQNLRTHTKHRWLISSKIFVYTFLCKFVSDVFFYLLFSLVFFLSFERFSPFLRTNGNRIIIWVKIKVKIKKV